MALTVTSEADWKALLKEHKAFNVTSSIGDMKPERAIWFETTNFGWLFSAKDENGKRHLIAKF